MSRVRISTTVDGTLLAEARNIEGSPDSKLFDASLRALLKEHRRAELDAAYAAYETQPLSDSDAWGDLSSWHEAADSSRS